MGIGQNIGTVRAQAIFEVFKSRRDDLFIEQTAKGHFFLFFSGAGQCASPSLNASTRAAEKQKENKFSRCVLYKQVIPTGFKTRVSSRIWKRSAGKGFFPALTQRDVNGVGRDVTILH